MAMIRNEVTTPMDGSARSNIVRPSKNSFIFLILAVAAVVAACCCWFADAAAAEVGTTALDDQDQREGAQGDGSDAIFTKKINNNQLLLKNIKLELWSRGAFSFAHLDPAIATTMTACHNSQSNHHGQESHTETDGATRCRQTLLWQNIATASKWLGPVRKARLNWIQEHRQQQQQQQQQRSQPAFARTGASYCHDSFPSWICETSARIRGGSDGSGNLLDLDPVAPVEYQIKLQQQIQELGQRFGPDFLHAMELNQKDHDADCRKSCQIFYCATPPTNETSTSRPITLEDVLHHNQTTIASLSMGAVPPEDFADLFGFPLDLIKVTQNTPLFSKEEAARVIATAEAEGVAFNEYKSGKYRLGGDWLDNLPKTREWFNQRLKTTFFPLLTHLFPEIISSPSILRAHAVSLLKYNTSHPRTDVHIDNGILAMTLAMTPRTDYVGGGTFFEHMGADHVLHMDVGHGTFRPGSVRHGGHRVTGGTRYILGAFLLLEDKVEHVRRMKNRGSALRRRGDLDGAARHFEWALALNPKCTTCLKDWAEILLTQKKFVQAEEKIRTALELLEHTDSDALFTLGVLLSEQGRDDESIQAYLQSVQLNADDAELCFNLGVKLGAKGNAKEEMDMYDRAVQVDPKYGPAWLNWGTALAEAGNMEEAEVKFLKALECGVDVVAKAFMNLALLYHSKANSLALANDLAGAKINAIQSSEYVDRSKQLLDQLAVIDDEVRKYISQFKPLRLQCHRMLGQIHAGLGDWAACEQQFRSATTTFPDDPGVWQMLKRVLEVQGKSEEAAQVMEKVQSLLGSRQ